MGSYLVQTTSKISALAKSGGVKCARKLFDEMSHRDTMVWNTMLSCYTHLGLYQEALCLFHLMTRISNTRPDNFSFTATMSACAGSCSLRYGQNVHALIVVTGHSSCLPVNNSIIDMYAKCLSPCSAGDVFAEMELRNDVSWCSLLFAYVHANQLEDAWRVFDEMPKRVKVGWNTMIAGHARRGDITTCVHLFRKMSDPDQWTFSALMNACAESQEYRVGCMVHAAVVKKGWSSAVEASNSILSFYAQLSRRPEDVVTMFESIGPRTQVSWNAIIDAQMKIGDTHKALVAFQQAPERNVVSWTSMMTGYVRNGRTEEAIGFFVEMISSGLQPDDYSLGTALHACSILATLGHGRMIHSLATRHGGFHASAYVGNGLVNMYAKCGDIQGSNQAFVDIVEKDLVSWNTMLIAYGLHGWGAKALEVYEEMVASGSKPDNVTFISLLMTCSHSGLISRGRTLFETMKGVYGLSPERDHVACMVDMLARGGYLEEARDMANTHGVGEHLSPEMSYVVLSNLYCANEKWKEAELVRKAMADDGVKKVPGCSWIEVKNKVTAFVAGAYDQDMSSILCLLHYHLKNPPSLQK